MNKRNDILVIAALCTAALLLAGISVYVMLAPSAARGQSIVIGSASGTVPVTSGGTGGVTGVYDGRQTMTFGWRSTNSPNNTLCVGTPCHLIPFGIPTVLLLGTAPIYGFGSFGGNGWLPITRYFPAANTFSTVCTGNSVNSACDFTGEFPPALSALADILGTTSSTNLLQAWWAVTSVDLTTTVPALNGGAVATHYFGLATVTGTSNFLCCSADGTHASCVDTGVSFTTFTTFKAELDWRTTGHLLCTVNGTVVDKATDISTSTSVALTPFFSIKCGAGGTCQSGISQFIVSAKF